MALFLTGMAIFLGAHLFTGVARPARETMIQRFGANGYKGLFSIVSLVGFVLIIRGWPQADASVIYATPAFMRHIVYLLMPIALVLLASAYLPAGRIKAAVKHPMLAGVKIWAFAHLLVNGEVRSLILFGGFLAFAVIDRIAVKRRGEPTPGPGGAMNDVLAIIVGLGLTAVIMLYLHRYIAGVPLF